MSDASRGPVSTLPGAVFKPPAGQPCDEHPSVLAVKRIQGETDSFGCEYLDMCQACYDQYRLDQDNPEPEICEGCGELATDIKPERDPDEGLAGPVYYRCGVCRAASAEYHARMHSSDDDDDDDDHDTPPMDDEDLPPHDVDFDQEVQALEDMREDKQAD